MGKKGKGRHTGTPPPRSEKILKERIAEAARRGDLLDLQEAAEQLLALQPDNAELTLLHAVTALHNEFFFIALQGFRRFLERWPSKPEVADVRRTVEDMEPRLSPIISELRTSRAQAEALAAENERILLLLRRGHTLQGREAAQALHEAWPRFTPTLQVLAAAAWLQGDVASAEAAYRQGLTLRPEKLPLRVDLARLLVLSGRPEEAHALARPLQARVDLNSEEAALLAEMLSFLGDDAGVRAACERARRHPPPLLPEERADVLHLEAVAAMRQGDSEQAERLWEKALEYAPGLEAAEENLEALGWAPPLRPLPWAFHWGEWLPRPWVERFNQSLDAQGSAEMHEALAPLLEQFPEVRALVPALLDRGDPSSVYFALGVCEVGADAHLLEVLKRFALGERGDIQDRVYAARILHAAGAAREEELQLWVGQRRQPWRWLNMHVHGNPQRQHSHKVMRLEERAIQKLRAGASRKAEQLLREALREAPDSPDLLYNLAVARHMQGHTAEAARMTEDIHQRWPGYFFARCAVARARVRQGQLEEAHRLLEPLLGRGRYHATEAEALCQAQVEVLRAEGDVQAAAVWADLLQTLLPDDARLPYYQMLLGQSPEK